MTSVVSGGESLLGEFFQLRPKSKLSSKPKTSSEQEDDASSLDRLAAKLSSTLPTEPKDKPEAPKKPVWSPHDRKDESVDDETPTSNTEAGAAAGLTLPVPQRGKDIPEVVPHGLVRSPSGDNLVSDQMQFPFGCRITFWLAHESVANGGMQGLGSCSDVHEFWRCWNSIAMDKLPVATSLSVFRTPERPWPEGRRGPGGRWKVVCKNSSEASRMEMFERLVLALVGGLFDEGHDGAPWGVALPAFQSDTANVVEVWNKAANKIEGPTEELRQIIAEDAVIEFKPHQGNKDKDKAKP